MAPCGPGGERRLRGTGLYPTAALLNHECMPNLARFDAFDADPPPAGGGGGGGGVLSSPATPYPGDSARIAFRALHALPAGEELTCAYFPLHLSLAERQARCRSQYGFTCTCPRCMVRTCACLSPVRPSLDERETRRCGQLRPGRPHVALPARHAARAPLSVLVLALCDSSLFGYLLREGGVQLAVIVRLLIACSFICEL